MSAPHAHRNDRWPPALVPACAAVAAAFAWLGCASTQHASTNNLNGAPRPIFRVEERVDDEATRADAPGAASASESAPAPAPATTPIVAWSAPEGWDTLSIEQFESSLAHWLPSGRVHALEPATRELLRTALASGGPRGLRATILLARSAEPEAAEALLKSLEQRSARTLAGDPTGDACDVVAASALARATTVKLCGRRLEALATGRRPHPDLDVRVECAASALAQGRMRVIPFLLSILREGTSAQVARPNWSRIDDVTYAQTRAAAALCAHAGVTNEFRPEAPVAAREHAASELERALATVGSAQR